MSDISASLTSLAPPFHHDHVSWNASIPGIPGIRGLRGRCFYFHSPNSDAVRVEHPWHPSNRDRDACVACLQDIFGVSGIRDIVSIRNIRAMYRIELDPLFLKSA